MITNLGDQEFTFVRTWTRSQQ